MGTLAILIIPKSFSLSVKITFPKITFFSRGSLTPGVLNHTATSFVF